MGAIRDVEVKREKDKEKDNKRGKYVQIILYGLWKYNKTYYYVQLL
jgi:hypothetical protein